MVVSLLLFCSVPEVNNLLNSANDMFVIGAFEVYVMKLLNKLRLDCELLILLGPVDRRYYAFSKAF